MITRWQRIWLLWGRLCRVMVLIWGWCSSPITLEWVRYFLSVHLLVLSCRVELSECIPTYGSSVPAVSLISSAYNYYFCFDRASALRAFLNNQTEGKLDEGGPIIQLDGLDPPMYNESSLADLQTWILIASTSTLFTIMLLLWLYICTHPRVYDTNSFYFSGRFFYLHHRFRVSFGFCTAWINPG